MATAASSFLNPVAGGFNGSGSRLAATKLPRRARRRRRIQAMIAVCCVVDALVLMVYAGAGTIPMALGMAYALCGLRPCALYVLLSELARADSALYLAKARGRNRIASA